MPATCLRAWRPAAASPTCWWRPLARLTQPPLDNLGLATVFVRNFRRRAVRRPRDGSLLACIGACTDRAVWTGVFTVWQWPGNDANITFLGAIELRAAVAVIVWRRPRGRRPRVCSCGRATGKVCA